MEALNLFIIPAIVKAFDMLNKKEWGGLGKLILAVAVGAAAGYLGFQGLDIYSGIALGLQSAGIVTVAAKASNK